MLIWPNLCNEAAFDYCAPQMRRAWSEMGLREWDKIIMARERKRVRSLRRSAATRLITKG